MNLTNIQTQGRFADGDGTQFTPRFRVQYQRGDMSGDRWTDYRFLDEGEAKMVSDSCHVEWKGERAGEIRVREMVEKGWEGREAAGGEGRGRRLGRERKGREADSS